MNYTISKHNLHLVDSFLVSKHDFRGELTGIKADNPDSDVWERSDCSLCNEWGVHNACYMLGIAPERTKDCDLNYPQKWYVRLAYWAVGWFAWLIIP